MVSRREVAGWSTAITGALVMLLFGTALTAAATILLVAAAWCIKIDREEYAVQFLAPDAAELNR